MTNNSWQPQWVRQLNRCGELSDYDKLQEKHQKASKVVAKMKAEIEELEKEDKRLCNVISDLHDDIRRYDRKIKKQQMLINIQWDIIASLMELKGVIEE